MSIGAGTLLKDSTTYAAPTGGTSADISIASRSGTKVAAYFDGDSNFVTRRLIDFSAKDPVVQKSAPGGYTQAREKVTIRWPITLANGERTVCTGTIEIARDPEFTAAQTKEMRMLLLQILGDGDFTNFWDYHEMS